MRGVERSIDRGLEGIADQRYADTFVVLFAIISGEKEDSPSLKISNKIIKMLK